MAETGYRGERVPPERLRYTTQDEEAYPAPDPPPLLDHLVEKEDGHACPEELEEDDYGLGLLARVPRAPPRMYAAHSSYRDEREGQELGRPSRRALCPRFHPRSSFRMSLPWRSCRMRPAVTIGADASSVSVPCVGREDDPEVGELVGFGYQSGRGGVIPIIM